MAILAFAIFSLLSSGSQALAGDISAAQAKAAYSATMLANQANIAAFLALPCVTDSGKGVITGLQGATNKTAADTESEYAAYMAFVTKEMPGNGKCDGGFNAVQIEAGRRQLRSAEAADRQAGIGDGYHNALGPNLFDPVIVFNDSGGSECMETAARLYQAMESGSGAVKRALYQISRSYAYEAQKFAEFKALNDSRRLGCGDDFKSNEDQRAVIRSAAGEGAVRAPASFGKSTNGSSQITGVKEDADKRANAGTP